MLRAGTAGDNGIANTPQLVAVSTRGLQAGGLLTEPPAEGAWQMRVRRVALGLVMAMAAGLMIGQGLADRSQAYHWGGWLLLTGLLCVISGLRLHPRRARRMVRNGPRGTRLGELLVGMDMVSQWQLDRALAWQRRHPGPVGEILIRMRLITRAQLEAALEQQQLMDERDLRRESDQTRHATG